MLIVEDDPVIGSSLTRALPVHGLLPAWATDAATAHALATREPPDVVLLDLSLPDADGEDVARTLWAMYPGLPIVMLTARAEEADIVSGLNLGAVDYVTKPFRLAELIARLRVQLRDVEGPADEGTLRSADLRVDVLAHRVWLGERELHLAPREFALLVCLMRAEGRVLTRREIMAQVWDPDWVGSSKTLDVHIGTLRRRLGETPGAASRIVSVRGVGYRLGVT